MEVGPNADEARSFLNGLVTSNIKSLQYTASSHYTAFLNAAGRVLDDVFIYPPPRIFEPGSGGLRSHDMPNEYLIEVDTIRAPDLIRHLKKHKLRRRLEFRLLDQEEGPVYSIWTQEPHIDIFEDVKPVLQSRGCWKLDPRPNMGARCILHSTAEMQSLLGPQNATFDDYEIHRMLNGVAEGPREIVPGSSLPQESNFDLFGGIDFRKGCYLGQELTIRTRHTGVVRKRILPVQLYEVNNPGSLAEHEITYLPEAHFPVIPPGTDIVSTSTHSSRSLGKWLAGRGNIGLALCRLSAMTDTRLAQEEMSRGHGQDFRIAPKLEQTPEPMGLLGVKASVPPWMRLGMERTADVPLVNPG